MKTSATARTAAARLADAGAAEEEDALEHSTLTPFFTATRQAQARVTRLETEVSELSDTTKFYLREARTRECAVTVAQRPLSRLLLRIYFQVSFSPKRIYRGKSQPFALVSMRACVGMCCESSCTTDQCATMYVLCGAVFVQEGMEDEEEEDGADSRFVALMVFSPAHFI